MTARPTDEQRPGPTTAQLQQQLARMATRIRDVEAIAFRPIYITINAPGWPKPIEWFRRWWRRWARRHDK